MLTLPASIAFSVQSPAAGAPSLELALERIRRRTGVATASFSLILSNRLVPLCQVGMPMSPGNTRRLERRAARSSRPLIEADLGEDAPARFFAGIRFAGTGTRPTVLLSLFDPLPRSPDIARGLAEMAIDYTASDQPKARIAELEAALIVQTTRLNQLAAYTADTQRMFDRASANARIGVWQCDLADESLIWTDTVYDLFEIPRGIRLVRGGTVDHYTEPSRLHMSLLRRRAIVSGSDFTLDAEITTARGNRRWMRLTGSVERRCGRPVRLFGMKQDITEEKLTADRHRYLAEYDVMTGLPNRSQFQSRLADLDGHWGGPKIGALLLVDLDGFKQINDTYGHTVGDECLKEAATRLSQCCTTATLAARIGGDEFAVLLPDDRTPAEVQRMADRIVAALSAPVENLGTLVQFGASVGIAYRAPGPGPDLFQHADTALYAAKAAGRNTTRTYGSARTQ